MPEFYNDYINEAEDLELSEVLNNYKADFLIPVKDKLVSLENKVYAEGKWTVKEILQHLIDAERIFSYRALTIARNDKTSLPGFEENEYVPESKSNRRSISDLLDELANVQRSTKLLFDSFDNEMLLREGICSGRNISVLAIGFAISGHALHHVNVIKERYLPLL